jgi:hypothetical protein
MRRNGGEPIPDMMKEDQRPTEQEDLSLLITEECHNVSHITIFFLSRE